MLFDDIHEVSVVGKKSTVIRSYAVLDFLGVWRQGSLFYPAVL